MSVDIYEDYWNLREALHFVIASLDGSEDHTPAASVVQRAKRTLKETDLAYVQPAEVEESV